MAILPQGTILAVGAPSQHVTLRERTPIARRCILATMTADHRIIDGALAAKCLATFTALLEYPEQARDQD